MEDLRPPRARDQHTILFAGVRLTFHTPLPALEQSNYLDAEIMRVEQLTAGPDDPVGDLPKGLFRSYNDLIGAALDKPSGKAWEKRLKDRDDPITIADLVTLCGHIVSGAADRPTVPLSPSGSTDGSGGTNSTDGSSSQEEEAPTVSASAGS